MLAHPIDDGPLAVIERSTRRTAPALGRDAERLSDLIGSVVRRGRSSSMHVLGPPRVPRHPIALARFGLAALQSADRLARRHFREPRARALFAGIAAHAMLPLDRFPTGAVGLVLGATAHTAGWPFPRGGAQRLADALAGYLRSLGGEIVTNTRSTSIDDLPAARAVLFDLSPRPLLRIAGQRFPRWYRRQLERYRYGMGVFKVDWALDAPIPWRDRAVRARRDRSSGRHAGGDRAVRARRVERADRRASLRAARAATPLRSDARAGRTNTSPGPTATSRTDRRQTCCRVIERRSSASPLAFATGSSRVT